MYFKTRDTLEIEARAALAAGKESKGLAVLKVFFATLQAVVGKARRSKTDGEDLLHLIAEAILEADTFPETGTVANEVRVLANRALENRRSLQRRRSVDTVLEDPSESADPKADAPTLMTRAEAYAALREFASRLKNALYRELIRLLLDDVDWDEIVCIIEPGARDSDDHFKWASAKLHRAKNRAIKALGRIVARSGQADLLRELLRTP